MKVSRLVSRYASIAAIGWSALIGASFAWNSAEERQNTYNFALNAARANFEKDQAYRLWASSHGGVYVEVTATTPPNPYLEHVPERDIVTSSGRQLTLMNPAYMLREMMTQFGELYGIKGKITRRVTLNPINLPDEWERKAIGVLENGTKEVSELADIAGRPYLRLMRPMFMESSCLKCHGHLGFKVGDLRGGVAIAVPMQPYLAIQDSKLEQLAVTHSLIWGFGMVAIAGISLVSFRRLQERQLLMDELTLSASVFDNGMDGIFITDIDGVIQRVNPAFSDITGYSASEAVGNTPRILKSDQNDTTYYDELWRTLLSEGHWEGEVWNRRKDGKGFAMWETISSIRGADGKIQNFISMFRDITDKKATEKHIYRLAHYDMLTKLPNRWLFNDRLEHAVNHAARENELFAVLLLDLDSFKNINDSFGHAVGDQLLAEIAERLRSCLRSSDTVARLGGDEFIVLVEDIEEPSDAERAARKILAGLETPVQLLGHEVYISGSVGVSVYPRDGADGDTLVKNADVAMYRSKRDGRNRVQFYDAEMSSAVTQRLFLESALRKAIEQDELVVYFQPKVALRDGRIAAAEALVRWERPDVGVVAPDSFIPLAEETGLIRPLGRKVLELACLAAVRWNRDLATPVGVAVNLSGVQLRDMTIVEEVASALAQSGLPAALLELEVTEGFVLTGFEEGLDVLRQLKSLGVSLSIDDFGTGYSSFSYLKQLPVDRLKIDRSFIAELPDDAEDRAIVSTIIMMAHNLGLQVTAEGVETEAQRGFLRGQDCDEIQGYFISRPLAMEKFLRLLQPAQ